MGIVHEFRCFGHGLFESEDAVCPHGCTAVEKVFITPRGIMSGRGAAIDRTFNQLANDFNLSDMNTNKSRSHNGGAARVLTSAQKKAQADQEKLRHRFAPMAKGGGTYHVGMGKAINESAGGGALASIAQHGAQPTDVMSQARENFIRPVHDVSQYQHKVVVKRDPDRDSAMKVKAG